MGRARHGSSVTALEHVGDAGEAALLRVGHGGGGAWRGGASGGAGVLWRSSVAREQGEHGGTVAQAGIATMQNRIGQPRARRFILPPME